MLTVDPKKRYSKEHSLNYDIIMVIMIMIKIMSLQNIIIITNKYKSKIQVTNKNFDCYRKKRKQSKFHD